MPRAQAKIKIQPPVDSSPSSSTDVDLEALDDPQNSDIDYGDAPAGGYTDSVDQVKIEQVIAGLGEAGGTVRITRKGPLDQAYQYLTKVTIDKFDIEHIKKVFGGGDYRCQTFRSNGQLYKPFEFSIDYRFKGSMDESELKAHAAATNNASATHDALRMVEAMHKMNPKIPDTTTPSIIRMMEQSAGKSEQMLLAMMQMQQASSDRTMQMITALVPLLVPLLNRPAPPDMQHALVEMIRAQKPVSETAKLTDMVALIGSLKDVIGGTPDRDEALWERILKAVGPSVGPLIAAATNRGKPVVINNQLPLQQPMLPGELAAPVENPPTDAPVSFSQITQMLLNGAAKDSDPGGYANLILDMFDDGQIATLKELLRSPSWRASLFGSNPTAFAQVEQHADWFEELKDAILEEEPPEEIEETITNEPITRTTETTGKPARNVRGGPKHSDRDTEIPRTNGEQTIPAS